MKGTHKHMEASLKRFNNHRCLSQSEENKCTAEALYSWSICSVNMLRIQKP